MPFVPSEAAALRLFGKPSILGLKYAPQQPANGVGVLVPVDVGVPVGVDVAVEVLVGVLVGVWEGVRVDVKVGGTVPVGVAVATGPPTTSVRSFGL
jgi:hypothetical protein